MNRPDLVLRLEDALRQTSEVIGAGGYQYVHFPNTFTFADELIEELERQGLKLVPA